MSRTTIFIKEAQSRLTQSILPFYLSLKDPHGGYFGKTTSTGSPDYKADRGVLVNAGIIWSFSAAYRTLRKREYLIAASHAKDYFIEHFVDHKYGGVYWAVDSEGKRTETKARLSAQAAAILGLSEFYRVAKDEEALKNAVNIYRILEKNFLDKENGGYIEALSRDFKSLPKQGEDEPEKTAESHILLLEAYSNLYRIWPEECLKNSIFTLDEMICDKMMGTDGLLSLSFGKKWNILSNVVPFALGLEASGILMESAVAVKDIDLINKIRPAATNMAEASLEGYKIDGGMVSCRLEDGTLEEGENRRSLSESVVGNLRMWKYLLDPEGADRALHTWDHISSLWNDLPVDFNGDSPFHETKMCLEILGLFD